MSSRVSFYCRRVSFCCHNCITTVERLKSLDDSLTFFSSFTRYCTYYYSCLFYGFYKRVLLYYFISDCAICMSSYMTMGERMCLCVSLCLMFCDSMQLCLFVCLSVRVIVSERVAVCE